VRLATKVAVGFALLLALMAGAGWRLLTVIDRLHADNRQLTLISFRVADLGREIRSGLDVLDEFGEKFLALGGDRGYFASLEQYRAEISADLARIRALDITPDERAAVERLAQSWAAYLEDIPARERAVVDAGGSSRRTLAALGAAQAGHLAQIDTQLAALLETSRQSMEARVAESAGDARQAAGTARIATAVALVVAVVLSVVIILSIRGPLARLTRGTRVLAEGDFSHRVPAHGSPELASLAEDFNSMARRLGELDRLKQDFVAGVSHDLRAPLASMEETTRLLLEGLAGPVEPRQRRMLELNLQATERLSSMIGDLLDLRRLTSGKVEYEIERLAAADLAREATEEAGELARRKGQTLRTEVAPQPMPVAADRSLLLQALRNLLTNAVKFTPDGGTVGLRVQPASGDDGASGASASGDGVLFEVWDTGPGVPDESKTRIFERFYRSDPDRKGRQGTGLGLAIARTIVHDHGGALWVEDRAGGGSRFLLRLPSPAASGGDPSGGEPSQGAA